MEAPSVRKKTQRPNPVEEREEAVPNIADSKHQAKKIERTLKPSVRGRDYIMVMGVAEKSKLSVLIQK